jgi:hypothetical protein
MPNFFSELKRSNVYKVAGTYVVVGWLIAQVATPISEVHALQRKQNKASAWLQIAFDNHDGGTLSLLVDPLLPGLRDDIRYKKLLAKLGLPAAT